MFEHENCRCHTLKTLKIHQYKRKAACYSSKCFALTLNLIFKKLKIYRFLNEISLDFGTRSVVRWERAWDGFDFDTSRRLNVDWVKMDWKGWGGDANTHSNEVFFSIIEKFQGVLFQWSFINECRTSSMIERGLANVKGLQYADGCVYVCGRGEVVW